MVFPDMLDQSFHVAADSIHVGVLRAEHASILAVCVVTMTFDDEAVRDLEASLVASIVLAHFPCFAGGEM